MGIRSQHRRHGTPRHVTPVDLGRALERLAGDGLRLEMVSNRGQKVYPRGNPETLCVDHWRCRFTSANGPIETSTTIELLARLDQAGFPFIKTEGLFTFDGEPGFTRGQGQ